MSAVLHTRPKTVTRKAKNQQTPKAEGLIQTMTHTYALKGDSSCNATTQVVRIWQSWTENVVINSIKFHMF